MRKRTPVTAAAQETARDGDFAEHLSRRFIGAVAALAGVAALLYGVAPIALPAGQRASIGIACTLLAVLGAALYRWGFGLDRVAKVHLMAGGVLGAVAVNAVGGGLGVDSGGLGFLSLLVCIVAVLGSRRGALGLAAAGSVLVIGMATAQGAGWLAGPPAAAVYPLPLRMLANLLLLLAGVMGGQLLSHAIERAGAQARAREQRFAGLLAVAADWYWEMDER